MSKRFLKRCRYKGEHLNLLYDCSFVLKSNQTLREAQFAVQTVVVFWLHSKYFHLSDFLILKKCGDAVIMLVYTYPQKFSILHSVASLMVCIPVAWVAPSL